jgi:hypothetical protein
MRKKKAGKAPPEDAMPAPRPLIIDALTGRSPDAAGLSLALGHE